MIVPLVSSKDNAGVVPKYRKVKVKEYLDLKAKHLEKIGLATGQCSSLSKPANQTNSTTRAAILLYSASAELRLTVCYFFDFQEIKESPSFTMYPVTDRLVLAHDAQSESQYPVSFVGSVPFFSKTPSPGDLFMYLTTLSAAS
ncbi:hypothetical protein MTR67_001335 [Solanum verrucosum]|uniref:Uncharacterized protein n=1 Tax=Solanum verrucosum TaxID=315347 RepID=A0AAF0PRP3_SOLVR|nr:hypothetical protein MTR67_001335 [Solanum verrucosum]